MNIHDQAKQNLDSLRSNPYPGRGIVIGLTEDGLNFVQIYWIMGRSENSRNRVFVQDGNEIRTAPFDESKVEDPSLIIYNCARVTASAHVVTNGDQTDTIVDSMENGGTFEQALYSRTYEPDEPNYTPRISGIVNMDDDAHSYQLGILKTLDNDPARAVRYIYGYEHAIPGVGHFVATYDGDGDPLPSFSGDPRPIKIPDDINATCDRYWDALDDDNRVSLFVKVIDAHTGSANALIVNKNG